MCTYLFTVQASNSIYSITDFPDFFGQYRRLIYAVSPRFIYTSLRPLSTFHLKEKWTTMLPAERQLAVRKARFESRLGTPGRFPNEPTAMKKMEMRKIISYATVMKIIKNVWNICFVLYSLFVTKIKK
jgi:hypothetical protein